jgi:hypothetical protein
VAEATTGGFQQPRAVIDVCSDHPAVRRTQVKPRIASASVAMSFGAPASQAISSRLRGSARRRADDGCRCDEGWWWAMTVPR